MQAELKEKYLFDANAIISLHRFSLWKQVIHTGNVAITLFIKNEVRFYRDELGCKKAIIFDQDIASQKLENVSVSVQALLALNAVLAPNFLQGIDHGEREAIGFLYENRRSQQYRFCTGDLLAIKCLGVLGLRYHGISLEEFCHKFSVKTNPIEKSMAAYSKAVFCRMLDQGCQESSLHLKKRCFGQWLQSLGKLRAQPFRETWLTEEKLE